MQTSSAGLQQASDRRTSNQREDRDASSLTGGVLGTSDSSIDASTNHRATSADRSHARAANREAKRARKGHHHHTNGARSAVLHRSCGDWIGSLNCSRTGTPACVPRRKTKPKGNARTARSPGRVGSGFSTVTVENRSVRTTN